MRKDKKEAFLLRKSGKSYNEIKTFLNIPKSTLSDWLRDIKWSDKIKKDITKKNKEKNTIRLKELNKIRGEHLKKIYEEAKIEALKEFEYFKFHPLFISGISLYWGEGDKVSKSMVRINNTDPLMIKLFINFLLKICGVEKEKIKIYLLLYPDLNENECKKFWIENIKLSKENFNKSIFIKGRHKTRRLKYGVCNIYIASSYLKEKIIMWLKVLPNELEKAKYYNAEVV